MTGSWTLDASNGELLLHTGVTGSAARIGHRLTIVIQAWQAIVQWDGDEPVAVSVTVELDSLDVRRGEGGMTPLTGAEKALIRSNALKTLRAKKFPQAHFQSATVSRGVSGYRLVGTLEIGGRTGSQVVDVEVAEDGESLSGAAVVRHTDYGIKQYSMLMGAMKVADDVRVTLTAAAPEP